MILFTAVYDSPGMAEPDVVDFSSCVGLLVTDDDLIEDHHTFTVAIDAESLMTNDQVGEVGVLQFTIRDDDGNSNALFKRPN